MQIFKFTLIIFIITSFVSAISSHKQSGEKARMLMKWKLTEYLDISEEQGDTFFPRFNSFQKEHKSIHKQIGELFNEVDEMINDDKIDVGKIKEIKNQINELNHKRHQLKSEFIENNQDILTDEQLAKLLVFEHKFKRKLKNEFNPSDNHFMKKRGFKGNRRGF